MDVKNASLNGNLPQEEYVVPPLGVTHNPRKICRLRNTLHRTSLYCLLSAHSNI